MYVTRKKIAPENNQTLNSHLVAPFGVLLRPMGSYYVGHRDLVSVLKTFCR